MNFIGENPHTVSSFFHRKDALAMTSMSLSPPKKSTDPFHQTGKAGGFMLPTTGNMSFTVGETPAGVHGDKIQPS